MYSKVGRNCGPGPGIFSKVRCMLLVLMILLLPVKRYAPDSQDESSASFICKIMLDSKLSSKPRISRISLKAILSVGEQCLFPLP